MYRVEPVICQCLLLPTLLNLHGTWMEPRTSSRCWRTSWTVRTYWTCCLACCRRSSLSACCWSGVGRPPPSLSGSGTLPQRPATMERTEYNHTETDRCHRIVQSYCMTAIHKKLHELFSIKIRNLSPREGTCVRLPNLCYSYREIWKELTSICSAKQAYWHFIFWQ